MSLILRRKERAMTREEAIRMLSNRDAHGVPCGYTSGYQEAFDMAVEALKELPKRRKEAKRWKRKALKAEPKHGEWVHEGFDYMTEQECWSRFPCFCSECKQETRAYFYNYCPNCGAKMNGGKK